KAHFYFRACSWTMNPLQEGAPASWSAVPCTAFGTQRRPTRERISIVRPCFAPKGAAKRTHSKTFGAPGRNEQATADNFDRAGGDWGWDLVRPAALARRQSECARALWQR